MFDRPHSTIKACGSIVGIPRKRYWQKPVLAKFWFGGVHAIHFGRTGQYIDDSVITTKTKSAFFNDPNLKATEINVETFKGRVQLSGFVKSQADINHAVSLAKSIPGVTSVKNDMLLN
jgi:osmotically-inducible protein OsmY